MLTKAGLAVIGALSTGREATAADLAMETEYSQTHLYDVLDELLESGCSPNTVGQTTSGRSPSQTTQSSKRTGPFDPNSDTLNGPTFSPATLRVCWYLDEPRRVSEIAERLKITRQGVHKALSPLKHRAMLSPPAQSTR